MATILQLRYVSNAVNERIGLRELASNTTAAINHLNANQVRPTTPDYVSYLKENATTAHQLAEMTSDLVKNAKSRTTLEKMEGKLELPSAREP